MKSEKSRKGITVENLKLHGLICQVVKRLKNENFKQKDNIKSFGSGIRFLFFFPCLFKKRFVALQEI